MWPLSAGADWQVTTLPGAPPLDRMEPCVLRLCPMAGEQWFRACASARVAGVGPVVAADQPALGAPAHQPMVWLVTGPPAVPVVVPSGNIEVPAYEMAPDAVQPALEKLDTRLTQRSLTLTPVPARRRLRWPCGRSTRCSERTTRNRPLV